MTQYKKLRIIVFVYNEHLTIHLVLNQLLTTPTLGLQKEIIVIDDCSTDGTADYLKSIKDPQVKVIFQKINQGKGAAL